MQDLCLLDDLRVASYFCRTTVPSNTFNQESTMSNSQMIVPSYHVELVQDGSHEVSLDKFDLVGSCARVLHQLLDRSPVEKFVVLYLNFKNEITGSEVVAQGDLDMVQMGERNM